VAAQAEPERLQRDDLLGRDVPEVDPGAEVLDEPGLARLRRRLPDEVVDVELVGDLLDQAGAHVAVLAADAGAAAHARARLPPPPATAPTGTARTRRPSPPSRPRRGR